jgi:DNA-binding transcriptional ArsR family regulator
MMAAEIKSSKLPNLTALNALEQAAEFLKTLAHPHRLRIVEMLLRGRFTVGELAEACGISNNVASEHLRLMQRCEILKKEKDGRRAYYGITEPPPAGILACVEVRFDGQFYLKRSIVGGGSIK